MASSPSEQEFTHVLAKNELLMYFYFGHGSREQYIRSHKIRHSPRCAATILWGCSSGLLRDMGEFDRIGTLYNYMLAGWLMSPFPNSVFPFHSPKGDGCGTTLIAFSYVTDRDIDKPTQARL